MYLKQVVILAGCMLMALLVNAQKPKKQLTAKRTTAAIKVDGHLDEAVWKDAPVATNFIETRPNPGTIETQETKTEIYILYDNTAVYVGGFCHERVADSISKELIGRDRIGANDFVGVIFDTYHDKLNGVGFFVTPYGEQFDAKYSPSEGDDEDDSWNAVWDSEAKVLINGWTFEMRIPYSALRFNSKEVQTWGLNIIRRRNKTGQQLAWNEIDPKVNGFLNQSGEWIGIEKIKSPVRLSFSPYFSAYANHYPYSDPAKKDFSTNFNGGMDLKYGINQSYTLDVTLIPDFGQVQSDNEILNLSPFEVKYNENRAFFTEGTELFSKGNLFYSRRIGGRPLYFDRAKDSVHTNEKLLINPTETKLINATKISGRNKKGLGMGFFNAITQPMYAIIEDNNKQERKVQTAPHINYNIFVLDQTMKNNSSVSLINTNVLRSGSVHDANVTAFLFNLNNKKNSYKFSGKLANSNLFDRGGKNISGYAHNISIGKTSGNFLFNIGQELNDHKYEINDMGLMNNNNFIEHYMWMGYRWLKPKKWYNRLQLNYNFNYTLRFFPGDYQSFNNNINMNAQFKNLWWAGIYVDYHAVKNDFYEPRIAGKVYKKPANAAMNGWIETNPAKKYTVNWFVFIRQHFDFGGTVFSTGLNHRYRFSDKLSVTHDFSIEPFINGVGFTTIDTITKKIIFSRRNRNTIENILNIKYNFNYRMGITARVRHYWSKVDNKEFFTLLESGLLEKNNAFNENKNLNVNIFNVDVVYTWQFAPGSFLNVVWKNSIVDERRKVEPLYFKNLAQTVESPQNNSISIKVLYYLDYLQFKKRNP